VTRASAARSNSFLAVQRVQGDDGAWRQAEFGQQRLGCGNFVGLRGDVDMGQDQGGVGGQRAEDLDCGPVVEPVEAAPKRLAVERDAALARLGAGGVELGGMAAEHRFHRRGVEALEDVADGGMRGRTPPCQPEDGVQPGAVDVDEGDDAAVGVGAGRDGEDRKQQNVGQPAELALGTPGIGNVGQHIQQGRERDHGNLRLGCHGRSQTLDGSGILSGTTCVTSS